MCALPFLKRNNKSGGNAIQPGLKIEGLEPKADSSISLGDGTLDVVDLIAPSGLLFAPDHARVGSDRYVRSFYVTAVPAEVVAGWLEGIYSLGDVDVSIHIDPLDPAKVIDSLTTRITELEAQLILDERAGYHKNMSPLRQEADDAWQLRAEIQTNRNRMYWVTIVFSIASDSMEKLERASKIVRERLGGQAVHVRDAFLRQGEAMKSVLPLGQNFVWDVRRNFDLGAATSLFPFAGADLAHPGGVFLGINKSTGAPVFYNSFVGPPILTNPHMAVIATTGAGKTTLVRLLVARSAVQGVRTLVLDPEGDYAALCKTAGGVYVKLAGGVPSGLNPFDIDALDGVVNIAEKVADLKGFVRVMAEGTGGALTPEENIIVEETLREEYEALGINEDPESLYTTASGFQDGKYRVGRVKKRMPTLSSFWERLRSKGAERACLLLKPYLRGNSLGIFDCESTIDLAGSPIIVFDVSRLEEGFVRPFAMHVVLGWVWENWVKRDREPKRVICDEAWMFLKHKDTMAFLENMARRGRKRNCSLCVATQNFTEFMRSDEGKSTISNLDTLVLMQQNPEELDDVATVFKLNEKEKAFLRTAGIGEALIRAGRQVVTCRVIMSEEEKAFIEQGAAGKAAGEGGREDAESNAAVEGFAGPAVG
jgi:hypothetical protein